MDNKSNLFQEVSSSIGITFKNTATQKSQGKLYKHFKVYNHTANRNKTFGFEL